MRLDSGHSELTILKSLRKTVSVDRSRAILEQASLQCRARIKFSTPGRMLFTARSLEQATSEPIARFKAGRFSEAPAIADLCCGIGGDLISLAANHPAVGFDADPNIAFIANHNVRRAGLAAPILARQVESLLESENLSRDFGIAENSWLHIDPDRRTAGRTTDLAFFHPPAPVLESLIHRHHHCGIKLAPASRLPESWLQSLDRFVPFERQWINHQRECKQQMLWTGNLAKYPGKRTATILDQTGAEVRTVIEIDEPKDQTETAASCGTFLYEPLPAVIAARLQPTVALENDLKVLAGPNDVESGYLTGNEFVSDRALATFEVIQSCGLRIDKVQSELDSLNIGTIELKYRNLDQAAVQPFRKLKGRGEHPGTLVLIHTPEGRRALICRRIDETSRN